MALEEDDVPGSSTGTRSRRTSRRSPWARCVPRPDRRRRRRRRSLRAAGFRRAPPARRLGVNRLVLAAGVIHRHPFSVSAIEAAQERVRLGVMMWEESWWYPCPLLPGRCNEELRLQREDIPPDQRGDHFQLRGWSMTRSWISRRRWSVWTPQQMLEAGLGVSLLPPKRPHPRTYWSTVSRVVSSMSRALALDALRRNVRVVVCN
jgi:hypothetical protein